MADWLKNIKILDALLKVVRDNKYLLILLIGAGGSAYGNISQHFTIKHTEAAVTHLAENVNYSQVQPRTYEKPAIPASYDHTDILKRLTDLEKSDAEQWRHH